MCGFYLEKGKESFMRVFLLAGKARSGKDWSAQIIKKHVEKAVVTSFSRYPKMYAKDISDWGWNRRN